jgi:hypothetical protein
MNLTQAIQRVRRGLREFSPTRVSDDEIESTINDAVVELGLKIEEVASSYFQKQASLSSDTFIFPWPSDCRKVLNVWDLGGNAGTITGATNASPIVITEASHGRSTGDIVVVHGVGGNTAANDTWKITVLTDDTYSLDGSTGNAAYTSGGSAYSPPTNAERIRKKNLADAELDDSYGWYPRGRNIVVDDKVFTNDLVVEYNFKPSELSDIPEEFHTHAVDYAVWSLIDIPAPDSADFQLKNNLYERYYRRWLDGVDKIETHMEPSAEPSYIQDEFENDFEVTT